MKLSEHLAKKFHPSVNKRNCQGGMYGKCILSEDIDEWITDWYKKEYERLPPMWLVGTEISVAEQGLRQEMWICKSCGKSTYETEYDYLAARDMHLECALKKEMKDK